LASFAALRAAVCELATTAKIGCPTYCTRPSARIGSSAMIGPQSLTPGISSAVMTATTSAADLTASRSIDLMLACACWLKPSAM
jgi:hypothetical protein